MYALQNATDIKFYSKIFTTEYNKPKDAKLKSITVKFYHCA